MKTSEIIRELCGEANKSVTKLEAELGFGNGSLTKDGYLRSDRLYTVAQYFGVSMEYLMGVSDAVQISARPALTFEEEAVVGAYKSADDDIKKAVCKLLDVKRDLLLSKGA